MKIIFILALFIIGIILLVFNERFIKLFGPYKVVGTNKTISHNQDRLRKIIAGIFCIILAIWMLLEYLDVISISGQYVN